MKVPILNLECTEILFLKHYTQSLMGGWLKHYSFRCQPVDYTENPVATRVSDGHDCLSKTTSLYIDIVLIIPGNL